MMQLLHLPGLAVNLASHGGYTPLHLAYLHEQAEAQRKLKEMGANELIADNGGRFPLALRIRRTLGTQWEEAPQTAQTEAFLADADVSQSISRSRVNTMPAVGLSQETPVRRESQHKTGQTKFSRKGITFMFFLFCLILFDAQVIACFPSSPSATRNFRA